MVRVGRYETTLRVQSFAAKLKAQGYDIRWTGVQVVRAFENSTPVALAARSSDGTWVVNVKPELAKFW